MPKTALKSKPVAKKKTSTAKVSPKPEGYSWVSPYLTVKDPTAAVAWYQKAFGFQKKYAMEEGGKVKHAELTYQDNTIMLGPECPQQNSYGPAYYKGTPTTFYVYTTDVDKVTAQAKKAGARIAIEPKTEHWGDRISLVIDPEGHQWMFATRVSETCGGESASCSN